MRKKIYYYSYRNIPLAIMISMPIVTVLYLLVNVSYFSVMSIEDLLNSPAVGIVSQSDISISYIYHLLIIIIQ